MSWGSCDVGRYYPVTNGKSLKSQTHVVNLGLILLYLKIVTIFLFPCVKETTGLFF